MKFSNMNRLLFLPILLLIAACHKAGEGGDATLRGYVHVQKFNSTFTQYLAEYPARDVAVYLRYGDRQHGYDDRKYTDEQGYFDFPYLYEGDYTLWVYSKDSTLREPSGEVPVLRQVHLSNSTGVVETDTILIFQVK